jgi:hypothetical protein
LAVSVIVTRPRTLPRIFLQSGHFSISGNPIFLGKSIYFLTRLILVDLQLTQLTFCATQDIESSMPQKPRRAVYVIKRTLQLTAYAAVVRLLPSLSTYLSVYGPSTIHFSVNAMDDDDVVSYYYPPQTVISVRAFSSLSLTVS